MPLTNFPTHLQDCFNHCGAACLQMALQYADPSFDFAAPANQQSALQLLNEQTCDQQAGGTGGGPMGSNLAWWNAPDGMVATINGRQEYIEAGISYEILAIYPRDVGGVMDAAKGLLLGTIRAAMAATDFPAFLLVNSGTHWWTIAGTAIDNGVRYLISCDPKYEFNSDGVGACRASTTHDGNCICGGRYANGSNYIAESALCTSWLSPNLFGVNWFGAILALVPRAITGSTLKPIERWQLDPMQAPPNPDDSIPDLPEGLVGDLPTEVRRALAGSAVADKKWVRFLDRPGGYFIATLQRKDAEGNPILVGVAAMSAHGRLIEAKPLQAIKLPDSDRMWFYSRSIPEAEIKTKLNGQVILFPAARRLEAEPKADADADIGIPIDGNELDVSPSLVWRANEYNSSLLRPYHELNYRGKTFYRDPEGRLVHDLSPSRGGG